MTDTTIALPEPGKCQACEWVYYTPDQMRAALARAAELERALVELVACKDLKVRADAISPVEPGCEKEVLNDEYRRRQPLAWAAARAAVAAVPMLPNSDFGHQAQSATPGVRRDGEASS